ncbi:MAG TPA: hypothetical protein VMB79_03110 [Jatrophihabitans sp.]|nr:hypothetical protein [Jatrophihabitans sp.]
MSARAAGSRRIGPVVGAVGFVLAWLAGLLVRGPGPALDAPGAEVAAYYDHHRGSTLAQAVLVHGVAAACLVLVVLGVEYATSRERARPSDVAFLLAGCLAAAISGLQLGFDITLSTTVGPADAATARLLFDTVNRLQAVKFCALAALALAGFELGRRRVLPRWLEWTALPLAAALLVAAAGYLTLDPALGDAAALALALLLLWVAGAGFAVSAEDHRSG